MKHGKHATVVADGGADYRMIADIMTMRGHNMQHATARNHIMSALRKIAIQLIEDGVLDEMSPEEIESMIRSPMFQDGICDVLCTLKEANMI